MIELLLQKYVCTCYLSNRLVQVPEILQVGWNTSAESYHSMYVNVHKGRLMYLDFVLGLILIQNLESIHKRSGNEQTRFDNLKYKSYHIKSDKNPDLTYKKWSHPW